MLSAIRGWFAKEPRQQLLDALGEASLPSFRPAVLQVLKTLRDPASTAGQVGDAVGADPGLAVKVLRLANSSAAGLKRKVDNVGHAAALLGRSDLEAIVLGVAVQGAVGPAAPAGFWQVAARRAATARALAERADPAAAPLCFAGGLLQDLAVPLLWSSRPDYPALFGSVPPAALATHEHAAYGWTHAQVAGWLCESWGFPERLRQAIEGHHEAGAAPVAVQLVALVDAHTAEDPEPVVEEARDRYDLRPDVVLGALHRGLEQGDELARALAS